MFVSNARLLIVLTLKALSQIRNALKYDRDSNFRLHDC